MVVFWWVKIFEKSENKKTPVTEFSANKGFSLSQQH